MASEIERPLNPGLKAAFKQRRCKAHRSSKYHKTPCKAPAVKGAEVCRVHGGSAKQVLAKARERLLDAVDPMLTQLYHLATDESIPAIVRRQAADSLLDRAGLKAASKVELTGADGGPLDVRHLEALDTSALDVAYREALSSGQDEG